MSLVEQMQDMQNLRNSRRSNLGSPNHVKHPVDLSDLDTWFRKELRYINDVQERRLLLFLYKGIDRYVHWATSAKLLIPRRRRMKHHPAYSSAIRDLAKTKGVHLDRRANGPAVVAFLLAGGCRPKRYGSNNSWSVHHIYSGKFEHPGKRHTLRAVAHGSHFTQSAGLVAIHPIADQAMDEYPFFAWLLRANAYQNFRYDPDRVFAPGPWDPLGFEA